MRMNTRMLFLVFGAGALLGVALELVNSSAYRRTAPVQTLEITVPEKTKEPQFSPKALRQMRAELLQKSLSRTPGGRVAAFGERLFFLGFTKEKIKLPDDGSVSLQDEFPWEKNDFDSYLYKNPINLKVVSRAGKVLTAQLSY